MQAIPCSRRALGEAVGSSQRCLPTLRLRAGASLFQCDGESRPLHVDLIAIGSLAQRLQQIYQRLFRIQIFEWARICAHGVDIFLADDPAEQQLLVRHAWCRSEEHTSELQSREISY